MSGESEAAPPQIRPVRTVTVEKREAGQPVSLTGRIEAEDEVALAFAVRAVLREQCDARRPGQGRAGDRPAGTAERTQRLALGQAALCRAGPADRGANHFDRQDRLLRDGWTTRANYEQAARALRTAEAQVDAAEAQLKAAHDTVSFTELEVDAPGVITQVGPAAGEVVQVGQPIARLARQDGREAAVGDQDRGDDVGGAEVGRRLLHIIRGQRTQMLKLGIVGDQPREDAASRTRPTGHGLPRVMAGVPGLRPRGFSADRRPPATTIASAGMSGPVTTSSSENGGRGAC